MAQVTSHASATKSPLHLRRHDAPELVPDAQEPETDATWALPVVGHATGKEVHD